MCDIGPREPAIQVEPTGDPFADRDRVTAAREAMDRELKLDPIAGRSGFTQDGARRVIDAYQQTPDLLDTLTS